MLKTNTQIVESPKKLDVTELITAKPTSITLDALPIIETFNKVTVNVKVMIVKEQTYVADKILLDVFVADQLGTAKVCLWEEHVNSLALNKSYCLKNFTVKEYRATKYFQRRCRDNSH